MMNLVGEIFQERNLAAFQQRLNTLDQHTRAEILEIVGGLDKRDEYFASTEARLVNFDTPADKLEKLKEWYPRSYQILKQQLPGFVLEPNGMPRLIRKMADRFVLHTVLPADRLLLCFDV